MFAHADIQGWFLGDTEGAAQWGDIQHATQPTRTSCNGRPLEVLAPALVARLMVVLSEKKTSPPDTYSTKTGIACQPEKLYAVSIACALPKGRLCNGSTCSGFENARPVQGAWNSAGGQSAQFLELFSRFSFGSRHKHLFHRRTGFSARRRRRSLHI
jgi:hypothetical protein